MPKKLRMRTETMVAVAACALVASLASSVRTTVAQQQHSYSAEQIAEGGKLYVANCGRCHGEDGSGVAGIDLFKQIRRATTDEDVARVIQAGIPGTSMPPHSFSSQQAASVVAFLRSMVGSTPGGPPRPAAAGAPGPNVAAGGDPGRGKEIFSGKGGCIACHAAETTGGTSGPSLRTIGMPQGFGPFIVQPDPALIAQSILEPDADIALSFRMFQVTPKRGSVVRGLLLNQDTFSVQLLDEAQNLRSFQKSDLAASGFMPSAMPSYRGRLTPQELADVVSYLLTLKG
jgi:putative heme-binding domain-containing protein